ncbi:MAG: hypothetical protein U0T02_00550 [Solirubrobacteraceae bacterium]
MATREIRTANVHEVCDVCGRSLLRGEQADTFLQAGVRRAVCELCAPRALREGWVREGDVPESDPQPARSERRRGLVERLRGRRSGEGSGAARGAAPGLELGPPATPGAAAAETEAISSLPDTAGTEAVAYEPGPVAGHQPPRPAAAPARPGRAVRAVPMSSQQRVAAAIECFNASEHPRTISGVARTLGAPEVAVRALDGPSGEVSIVVAWELSWYRFEVLLGDDEPSVRLAAQGHELAQLGEQEREPNAAADERGHLSVS